MQGKAKVDKWNWYRMAKMGHLAPEYAAQVIAEYEAEAALEREREAADAKFRKEGPPTAKGVEKFPDSDPPGYHWDGEPCTCGDECESGSLGCKCECLACAAERCDYYEAMEYD